MIPNDGGAGTGRREFLFSVAPAGVLACLGCERVGRLLCASASPIASPQEKFGADSQLTFEEVYKFAFASNLIPLLKSLREELPGPDYLDRLKRAGERMATGMGAAEAKGVPTNDFAAFKSMMNATDRFWDHVLTRSIVEDTDSAMQVRITECLWAKTFRSNDAADIGYATICHPDYAFCQGFNPRIRMERTSTLMQGQDHCDHRWIWQAEDKENGG